MYYTFRNNKRRIIDGDDDFFTSKIFIVRPDMSISRTQNTTQSEVITNDQFETMRPKRMRPRPVLHETKVETKANYCKTETTKVHDLDTTLVFETLTSLLYYAVAMTVQ